MSESGERDDEGLFRELFNASPDSAIVVSREGRVLLANTQAEIAFGYTRGGLVGVALSELIPERFRASHEHHTDAFFTAPRGGTTRITRMISARRSDGGEFPIDVSLAPMTFRGVPAVIASVRDVTDRVRHEGSLRSAQERVARAQQLDAMGRLAGGVAHDFNNLLSVILTAAEFIADDMAPDDASLEQVEDITKAAQRAATLTRQLLAFSRRNVSSADAIDLTSLIGGMDLPLRRIVGPRVRVELRTPSESCLVRANAADLERAVLNLVTNAREAMPQGGSLTLTVEAVTLDERFTREHVGASPGEHVRLTIADTGLGMTPETQARIFEPFFTTKPPGRGVGLGLAVVFGFVRQSHGTIWVESSPGAGTRVEMYLPRVREAESSREARPVASALRGTECVLLAEDEPRLRALLIAILKREGYEVLAASDGHEAVTLSDAFDRRIDLLLTDVVMPGMNGRELAEHLAAARPTMRVLYMSGYTGDALSLRGVLAEGSAFLPKPITSTSLLRAVREALDAPSPHAAAPR